MEAIIRHAGKQYQVKPGGTIDLELEDLAPDSSIEFAEVLFVTRDDGTSAIGAPTVAGAKVKGKVVGMIKGPKLYIGYLRRRKNSRHRSGHRQRYTRVAIESIVA